jgi:hypothetical protein
MSRNHGITASGREAAVLNPGRQLDAGQGVTGMTPRRTHGTDSPARHVSGVGQRIPSGDEGSLRPYDVPNRSPGRAVITSADTATRCHERGHPMHIGLRIAAAAAAVTAMLSVPATAMAAPPAAARPAHATARPGTW